MHRHSSEYNGANTAIGWDHIQANSNKHATLVRTNHTDDSCCSVILLTEHETLAIWGNSPYFGTKESVHHKLWDHISPSYSTADFPKVGSAALDGNLSSELLCVWSRLRGEGLLGLPRGVTLWMMGWCNELRLPCISGELQALFMPA